MCQLLKFASILLLVFTVATGCATKSKVTQDYKPDTDFSAYKTFKWHNFSSSINASNQIAIQREVEQQLSQQGFQLVSTTDVADLVLDLTIIKQPASASNTGVGLSIGLPIGRHGSLGLGTSKLLNNDDKYIALMILDISAQATNQVLWRGSAEGVPLDHFSLRNEQQLHVVLKNLIAQFPPN